jgi:hypothetical protein
MSELSIQQRIVGGPDAGVMVSGDASLATSARAANASASCWTKIPLTGSLPLGQNPLSMVTVTINTRQVRSL